MHQQEMHLVLEQ